jgi:hypothetical protein
MTPFRTGKERRAAYARKPKIKATKRTPLASVKGRRLLWNDSDGQRVITLQEFLRDNQDGLQPEELEAVRQLQPGESIVFGGGAAPVITVEALAPAKPARRVL